MLITLALVLPLMVPQSDSSLPRSGIAEKDLGQFGKEVVAFFEAEDVDDRSAKLELATTLLEDFQKAAKRAKAGGPPLSYIGDWDAILEMSKPDDRTLKSKIGKGFFKHVYTDEYGTSPVATILSIPGAYTKNKALIPPAILALKPALGLSGSELEKDVIEKAEALYADVLDTHIVLIPLGPSEGEGRRAESKEYDGAWFGPEGVTTLFTGLKVLLFQLRFDRGALTLDGWGDASQDALRLGALAPTWFAGVLTRAGTGAPPEDTPLQNLAGSHVLVLGDGDVVGGDRLRAVDGLDFEVIEDDGDWSTPGEAALERAAAWFQETRRDLAPRKFEFLAAGAEWGAANWCVIRKLNRRATALPEDEDFPRVVAEIDTASNTIALETVNVFELAVYLSDALVDLDRAVTIKVNGEEKFSGMLKRDLQFLLENRYYNNSSDYGVYTASVLLEGLEANLP